MFLIGSPILEGNLSMPVQRTRRQVESLALVAQAHMFMAQHQECIAHVPIEYEAAPK